MEFLVLLAASLLLLMVVPVLAIAVQQPGLLRRFPDDAVHGLEALRGRQRLVGMGQLGLFALLVGLWLGPARFVLQGMEQALPLRPSWMVVSHALAAALGMSLMPLGCRRLTLTWTGATWGIWHQFLYTAFWQWMFLGRGPALVYGLTAVYLFDRHAAMLTDQRLLIWLTAPVLLGALYTAQLILTPGVVRFLFRGERVEGEFPVPRYRYRAFGSRLPLAFAGGLFSRFASVSFNDELERALEPEQFRAVVLHEYAHILRHDVWNRLRVVLKGILIATALGYAVFELYFRSAELALLAAMIFPFLGVLGSTVVLRRRYWDQELEADVYAAQQVGVDTYGQALIRIHEILRLPAEWSEGDRRRAMHPSLMRRLEEIGYQTQDNRPRLEALGGDVYHALNPVKEGVYLEFHPVIQPMEPKRPVPQDRVEPRYRPRYRYSPPLRPDQR